VHNPPLPVQPDVCVIIAAYNAQATIARAIQSALNQPEAAEVIVVDDASTDDTVHIARAVFDSRGRLKVLVQPRNCGPSAARNRAIRESTSPWIAILDADDFFLPGRIKGLLTFSDNADLIADDMWQVAENAVEGPRKSLLGTPLMEPRTIRFAEFVLSNVTRRGRNRGELGFIKPLMRRQLLADHNIIYQEHMRLGEDFELYARALALGARLILIPAQGYISVVRPNSLSGQHSETDLMHLRDCDNILESSVPLSKTDKKVLRQHYKSVDCRLQWRLLIIAFKNKDISGAMSTFLRPWPVPLYLFEQLLLQVYLRSIPNKK